MYNVTDDLTYSPVDIWRESNTAHRYNNSKKIESKM